MLLLLFINKFTYKCRGAFLGFINQILKENDDYYY